MEVLTVGAPEEAQARLQPRLKEFFKTVPEGARVQVTVGQFFDQGKTSSTNKMQPYVYAAVPLDDKGRPNGDQLYWHPDAHDAFRLVPWVNGRKEGIEKLFQGWGKGRFAQTEIPWHKGEMEGAKRSFYDKDHLRSETTYRKGLADGPAKAYDKKGNVTRESVMHKGKRDGTMTDYWPGTTQVKRVIDYKDGLVDGFMREYYANGQLKREIPFRKDRMHGEEKQYEADGTLTRTRYWIDGDRVSPAEFKQRF